MLVSTVYIAKTHFFNSLYISLFDFFLDHQVYLNHKMIMEHIKCDYLTVLLFSKCLTVYFEKQPNKDLFKQFFPEVATERVM